MAWNEQHYWAKPRSSEWEGSQAKGHFSLVSSVHFLSLSQGQRWFTVVAPFCIPVPWELKVLGKVCCLVVKHACAQHVWYSAAPKPKAATKRQCRSVFFFSTIRLEISFLVTITIGQVSRILRMPHSTLSRWGNWGTAFNSYWAGTDLCSKPDLPDLITYLLCYQAS